jgi:hypothetical protein
MIVSERYKYIYVAILKTGSSSMRGWLSLHFVGKGVPGVRYHSWDIPREYREYFKFTVVRNPYDRMMSSYFFGKERWERGLPPPPPLKLGMTPVEHIQTIMNIDWTSAWMSQAQYVDEIKANAVLKLEEIPDALKILPFINMTVPPFPHRRRTPEKPKGSPVEILGEEWATLVGEYEAATFERYGYERLL